MESCGALVAADAHFAYEDVIGGALPLWSTREIVAVLATAIAQVGASELILLGDVIHGSRMSEGAAEIVAAALDTLRTHCEVTLIAGNHEGRTRGVGVLGPTHERVERAGWALVHGDRDVQRESRAIVGHLHPSLGLGGGVSARAFLYADRAVVVPALNPYSRGLDVLSGACARALGAFGPAGEYSIVVSDTEHVYPFGALSSVRDALRGRGAGVHRFRRKLSPD